MSERVSLRRSLSLPLLTLYGLGTIVGAGIYVLSGKVAGMAGMAAPVAFLVASVLAAFSAFSYAELAARFPVSAGEAAYSMRAFGREGLATAVGLAIALVGLVSAGTMARGFVGYLQVFWAVPDPVAITGFLLLLGAVAAWGISQSAWLAAGATVVEVAGLVLVLWAGGDALGTLPARWPELIPELEIGLWVGVLSGAFIAFYAFIGFEDIVKVAEEVRDPARNLAWAILLALGISTLFYVAVSTVSVLAVPPDELGASEAPLALVYERASGLPSHLISAIGIAAVINGALVQLIMASRMLYGMAREGWLPRWFAAVHPATRTPLRATALVLAVVLALALAFPLVRLAEATSFINLLVFCVVNLSLWVLKGRAPRPEGVRVFPRWVPLVGFLASAGFLVGRILGI
ncbi:MAG TPA: amino acid permease [Gammaproteobacteria bacterium]|nr:amino acid permease [Gammaproteobacteria bacterium]